VQNLSRHHIKYVLGIDIPLNESYQLNESQYKQIIEAQLLYETFLDTIKDYTKGAYNKVVTTIKNWTDAAVVFSKVLSNEQLLQNFSTLLWSKFTNPKTGLINKVYELINKLGLTDLKDKVEKLVQKIQQLSGWKKFMAATAIVTLTNFIISKVKNFPTEKIKEFIINYLSNDAIGDILSKLKDFDSYVGWLKPIIGTVDALYNALEPAISRFSKVFKGELKPASPQPQTETSMKLSTALNELKVSLDQLMKGVDTEMEHTKKPSEALKIAIDHFKEDPKYYDKLVKVGLEEDEMIRCKNCAHRWRESEGGKDKYFCHKCEKDNTPIESLNEGEFCPQCLAQYIKDNINSLQEAEYQGRKVQLGVPMAGDVKKFKVYVKNAKGNVVKVNFGQKGVKIKKNNPARRKSFRARHHCDTNPGPKWKARYWSCRKW
jgi:DNA-directed RNA polymerase subunit RPC12/RpoP